MQLDLRLLEVFCCVYEQRSFSKAGELLFLSQPTISGHIKSLEDHLGVSLFARLPRTIVPSAAGELLYRHGRRIMEQRKNALQELQAFLDCMEGPLSIAASTIPGEYLLPPLLVSFRKDFAKVDIDLRIADSRIVCEKVIAGDIELGFVGFPFPAVDLEFEKFASDELVLAALNQPPWSELGPLHVAELKEFPLLIREKGSGTRLAFEDILKCSLNEFQVAATLSSTNAIRESLKAGLGLSMISKLAVQTELSSGVLRVVEIRDLQPIRRDFFTVVNRRLEQSPIARRFFEFVCRQQQLPSKSEDPPVRSAMP